MGPHKNLSMNEIVQELVTVAGTKRFRDLRACDLITGTEYYVPIKVKDDDTPRSTHELISYMVNNCLEVNTMIDLGGNPETGRIYDKWGTLLVEMDYGVDWLCDALNYLMDQEANQTTTKSR